jgi:hypothetical protein
MVLRMLSPQDKKSCWKWEGNETSPTDREEGAITLTLCRLDQALGSSRDDHQRAEVKMRIASVLRQIGLHEEASYLVQEARDLYRA